MENQRLDKVESKIDQVQKDVSELKSDFKVHVTNMEHKLGAFKDHIAGDNKIITHILPIIEEWKFQQKASAIRKERLKISIKVLTLFSLIGGLYGILNQIIKP
jgi:hypothetical protein